jgi:acyl-CoA thioesterase
MPGFSEVLSSFSFDGAALRGRVADNWLQGRTLYGGMAAALCLEGAQRAFPDLPPLRSAQISFIGPAEGEIEVTMQVLRRGKSVTFVNADLAGEKGLAARCVFAFGAARETIFHQHFIPAPDLPGPDEAKMFFPPDQGPTFARNFDVRLARGGAPVSRSKEHDHFLWVRHRDHSLNSIVALLALADMPPPAMMPMFPQPAPISTMTWALNFLTDHPQTDDGWWLMESKAENAGEGYSSQDMFIWSRSGEPAVAGRQSVAIFI